MWSVKEWYRTWLGTSYGYRPYPVVRGRGGARTGLRLTTDYPWHRQKTGRGRRGRRR